VFKLCFQSINGKTRTVTVNPTDTIRQIKVSTVAFSPFFSALLGSTPFSVYGRVTLCWVHVENLKIGVFRCCGVVFGKTLRFEYHPIHWLVVAMFAMCEKRGWCIHCGFGGCVLDVGFVESKKKRKKRWRWCCY
jgi:hypothetical protein